MFDILMKNHIIKEVDDAGDNDAKSSILWSLRYLACKEMFNHGAVKIAREKKDIGTGIDSLNDLGALQEEEDAMLSTFGAYSVHEPDQTEDRELLFMQYTNLVRCLGENGYPPYSFLKINRGKLRWASSDDVESMVKKQKEAFSWSGIAVSDENLKRKALETKQSIFDFYSKFGEVTAVECLRILTDDSAAERKDFEEAELPADLDKVVFEALKNAIEHQTKMFLKAKTDERSEFHKSNAHTLATYQV